MPDRPSGTATAMRRLRRVADAITRCTYTRDRICSAHAVGMERVVGEDALAGTMDDPTLSQRWLFDTQGYLLVPDVLSSAECATLISCGVFPIIHVV
jgi:hypothetical protein